MATIKSYTDLEQSKKLKEILPIESADMIYLYWIDRNKQKGIDIIPTIREGLPIDSCDIPCWSLAALLEQLKAEIQLKNKQILFLHINKYDDINYDIRYTNSWTGEVFITEADNLVDACVAMILKLHELNLL